MPRRKRTLTIEPFPLQMELQATEARWFVYAFALTDCTAFKVGFSCNPLQRISTFSRRYFEQFDLSQSLLLELPECEAARVLEATLKSTLAPVRVDAPSWVPHDAGGHTEWFSAVYFGDAETTLRAASDLRHARALGAFDVFREQLERASDSFESWAIAQAQRASEMYACAQRGYAVRDHGLVLRDWLDAYRYFDLPLFAERPEVSAHVRDCAALGYR